MTSRQPAIKQALIYFSTEEYSYVMFGKSEFSETSEVGRLKVGGARLELSGMQSPARSRLFSGKWLPLKLLVAYLYDDALCSVETRRVKFARCSLLPLHANSSIQDSTPDH